MPMIIQRRLSNELHTKISSAPIHRGLALDVNQSRTGEGGLRFGRKISVNTVKSFNTYQAMR